MMKTEQAFLLGLNAGGNGKAPDWVLEDEQMYLAYATGRDFDKQHKRVGKQLDDIHRLRIAPEFCGYRDGLNGISQRHNPYRLGPKLFDDPELFGDLWEAGNIEGLAIFEKQRQQTKF